MIFTGFLSLLQILFLPGLIFNAFIKKESGILYRLSFIIAFSMLVNLIFTIVFVSLHAYTFPSILITVILELVAILFLYRKIIIQPSGKVISSIFTRIKTSIVDYLDRGTNKNSSTKILKVIKIAALLVGLLTIGWVIVEIVKQIGSVFGYWDSVISYNRWATEWSKGLFPTGACEYPQLLPANWSLTYVLTQSPVVIFAKLIQSVFPILFVLAFFDLGITLGSAGYMLGVPLSYILLKKFAVVSVFEGFMDVAVSTFILLAFYLIYKDLFNKRYSDKTLWLSGIVILAAAMTKQPGVLAFGAWVIINFLIHLSIEPGKIWKAIKKIFFPSLVLLLLIGSWYFFKVNRDALVGERSCIAITNSWAAKDLVTGFWETLIFRLKLLDLWILFIPIMIASIFIAKRELKLLLLCYGIPYLLISLVYGYYGMFIRYLAPISFVFALSAIVLIDVIIRGFLVLFDKVPGNKIRSFLNQLGKIISNIWHRLATVSFIGIIIFGILIIIGFGLQYSDSKLIRNFEYQQMGIGNRTINEYMVDFFKDKDPKDLTISWYPYINFLPGLEGRVINIDNFGLPEFKKHLQQNDFRFVLKYNSTPEEIVEYINQLEKQGQLIFVTDFGVKNDAVLYEVSK